LSSLAHIAIGLISDAVSRQMEPHGQAPFPHHLRLQCHRCLLGLKFSEAKQISL